MRIPCPNVLQVCWPLRRLAPLYELYPPPNVNIEKIVRSLRPVCSGRYPLQGQGRMLAAHPWHERPPACFAVCRRPQHATRFLRRTTLARPCADITHSRRQRCRLTPSEGMAV